MKRVSAVTRLRELPALFRGGELTMRFGWTSKNASQYLYLWKRAGLVAAFGGHSDVYANLIAQPTPDWERALAMAMPSAVIIGVDALRRAGWTTQIQQAPAVAIMDTATAYSNAHFSIVRRNADWYDRIASVGAAAASTDLPRCLDPAYALVDMIAYEGWGRCGLDPDDIDVDAIRRIDQRQLADAMRRMRVDDVVLTSWTQIEH